MGFYPLAGTPRYIVGAPLFPKITVSLGSKTLVIEAPHVSDTHIYVQSVTLNGEALTTPWLQHAQIAEGGTLHFEMGPEPSQWGR